MKTLVSDHISNVPGPPRVIGDKKKKPRSIAVVDEDNCTGCQVCVPFCPVDCIEPVADDKYDDVVIPPVHVRLHECIGCQICVRACEKLTWNAIVMQDTEEFEKEHGVTVTGSKYGWDGVERDASIGPNADQIFTKLKSEGKFKL